MADGKVVIETDLDSSGIEKGLKNTEKSMKAQAATLAAEYRKQGMNASDAFKKAWSEIERSSGMSSTCLLYTSPSPRDSTSSRMPSSA